jgi:hypothetical protein
LAITIFSLFKHVWQEEIQVCQPETNTIPYSKDNCRIVDLITRIAMLVLDQAWLKDRDLLHNYMYILDMLGKKTAEVIFTAKFLLHEGKGGSCEPWSLGTA